MLHGEQSSVLQPKLVSRHLHTFVDRQPVCTSSMHMLVDRQHLFLAACACLLIGSIAIFFLVAKQSACKGTFFHFCQQVLLIPRNADQPNFPSPGSDSFESLASLCKIPPSPIPKQAKFALVWCLCNATIPAPLAACSSSVRARYNHSHSCRCIR